MTVSEEKAGILQVDSLTDENPYRTILDAIEDPVHIIDSGYKIITYNRAMENWLKLTGISGPVHGENIFEIFPFLTKKVQNEYRQVFAKGRPVITKESSKILGKKYRTETRKIPVLEKDKVVQVVTTIHDISEWERIREVNEMLYGISEALYTAKDLQDLFKFIQKHLGRILNTKNFFIALYEKERDVINIPYFVDEKDDFKEFPAGKSLTAYVIKNDRPLMGTPRELERLARSGEAEVIGTPAKIWLGVPLKVRKTVIGALVVQSYKDEEAFGEADLDILKFISGQVGLSIERRQVLDALKESEEKYRSLVERANDGIVILTSTRIRFLNPRFAEMIGLPIKKITGTDLSKYITEKEWTSVKDKLKIIQSKKKMGAVFPAMITDSSGITLQVELNAVPIQYDGETATLVFVRNISERKMLEDQLRQSQKMEAVGRLAGGVAHDFNNLLTVIMGYSELLLSKIEKHNPLFHYVEQIDRAAERAESLTRQLLAFSRRQIMQPVMLNLNEKISDMENMLVRIIGERIELQTFLNGSLGTIKADPGQIEQVLMNLVVNARDAMPDGGILTIQTLNVDVDQAMARENRGLKTGAYVVLSLQDTGVGIDKEAQLHIFEPFYTTKEEGKGTGLGLATVYGIVKQSDGYIAVHSEPGEGTTFRIYFPRQETESTELRTRSITDTTLRGRETVLIVEDEDDVRTMVCETLRLYGYQVLEAEDGVRAMETVGRFDNPIHLMVTDVVMPNMNGRELADKMKLAHPETKVLFMSGYTDDAIVQQGILEPETEFIQKPFTIITFLKKIRELLGDNQQIDLFE